MFLLDRYIIKKYLSTFLVMILLFIPIGILVDMAEKIDKYKEKEVPLSELISYYFDFTLYFSNMLFPIFLFLAVIWFTSKMANNTEVIAMLSSGISFTRFLRPYLLAAGLIASVAFYGGMFVVPKSNEGFNDFNYKYINKTKAQETTELYKQINANEFIYVSNYNPVRKRANNFSIERFEDHRLVAKLTANTLRWIERDSTFRLSTVVKRTFVGDQELLETTPRKDTLFDFAIEELSPVTYKAETLNYGELNRFIKKERQSGSKLINAHLLVRHKRWSLPLSAFVLTIIAVAMSSFKRRGGMGVNLAFGITLGFLYIFFDKIFSVMVLKANFNPMIAAWLPLLLFGGLAVYLLNHAKR
ncbi:MAG: LptF/LptG family permease [Flavobacteriaceae bacterium]